MQPARTRATTIPIAREHGFTLATRAHKGNQGSADTEIKDTLDDAISRADAKLATLEIIESAQTTDPSTR